jgi:hypothetical protein
MNLSKLKTDDAIKTLDTDRVGGFRLLETDLYDLNIKLAYMTQAASEAMALNIVAETSEGGKVSEAVYMTSGKAKGGKNTYQDKEGNPQYLPGFVIANTLALLAVGKEIGDLDVEEKVINLYDYSQKKDVPTKVQMFVELVGKDVKAGIEKQLVDKQVKNDAGAYVSNGEVREKNEIVKFFRSKDSMSTTEIQAQATEAAFIHVWTDANKGQTKDKTTKVGGAKAAPAATGTGAVGGAKSLFA